MGRAHGETEGRSPAQRESDDRGPRDAERVEKAGKIANQVRWRIVLRIGRYVGQAMAALVVSDDAEALAQGALLMKPHALAAGEAVDEDNRLPRADIVE